MLQMYIFIYKDLFYESGVVTYKKANPKTRRVVSSYKLEPAWFTPGY